MKNVVCLSSLFVIGLLLCSFSGNRATPMPFAETEAVVEFPDFGGAYLVFAGKFGGDVTKKQVMAQTKLGVDGCAKGSRIFTYTLKVTHAGKTSSYSCASNVLSADMIAALKGLKTGDTFSFKNIKAYLPNGKDVVDVHSKAFTVV